MKYNQTNASEKPVMCVLHIKNTFEFECGNRLDGLAVTFSTWGTLNEDKNNVVWICHPLTCSADTTQWWSSLIGIDRVITPEKHFIVCVNVIGSCYGSTGPCSLKNHSTELYGLDFPVTTIKDIVAILKQVKDHLNITSLSLGIGASFGGQQLIEWMATEPHLFKNACIAGANAEQSPWAKAFNETQRMAIEADESFFRQTVEGGKKGLAAARAMAVLSYRSFDAYMRTQTEESSVGIDNYKASSYQRYIGNKFTDRFSALSYWYLTKAMDSHNIARHALSLETVLNKISTNTLLLSMKGDVLFKEEEMILLERYLPRSTLVNIGSTHGHDGLLANADLIFEALGIFIDDNSIF